MLFLSSFIKSDLACYAGEALPTTVTAFVEGAESSANRAGIILGSS